MKLVIDLGGTHLRAALGDGVGPWRHFHRSRRPAGMTPEAFVARLGEILSEWGASPADFTGIGVSAAAVVSGGSRVVRAENLGWRDVPLGPMLEEAFERPSAIETDVYCGALHEARHGHAQGPGASLYISVGTGVGHAFIFEGRIWRGATGGANAIGHLVLDPAGLRCYCGHRGCLCTLASGLAQSTPAAPAGALQALAQAIGAAATLIEPERVILAGGALDQPWFDLDTLSRRLPELAYPGIAAPTLIRSDVPDPNLRGAAWLVKDRT